MFGALRDRRRVTWRHAALGCVIVSAGLFDIYHAHHLLEYSAGRVGAVRAPLAVDWSTSTITRVEDEAANTGVGVGDTVLKVNGRDLHGTAVLTRPILFAQPDDLLTVAVRTPAGLERTAEIRLIRNTGSRDSDWSLFIIGLLLPLSCQILGFWLVASRPSDFLAWLLLLCSLGFGHRLTQGTEFREGTWLSAFSLSYLLAVFATYFGWLFWLSLRFPSRLPLDRKAPWIKWLLLAPLFFLTALDIAIQQLLAFDWTAAKRIFPAASLGQTIATPLRNICFALCVVVIIWRFLTEKNADRRRRLQLFFAGTLVALLPSEALAQIAHYRHQSLNVFPESLLVSSLLVTLLFPITLAYTIVVPRAPQVTVVLRQNVYRLLSRHGIFLIQSILALFILASLRAALDVTTAGHQSTFWMIAALLLVMVISHETVLEHMRSWMDRNVFPDAGHVESALQHFESLAHTFLSPKELLEQTRIKLAEAFAIRKVAVLVNDDGRLRPLDVVDGEATQPAALDIHSALATRLTREHKPIAAYFDDAFSWVHGLPPDEQGFLKALGAEVLVPVVDEDRLQALITIGPRAMNLPCTDGELGVLSWVARQTGLAMKNAELLQRIAAEVANRERLNAEKDSALIASRAKSEFLASMSHELRTPMNAIIGYSEMLIEDAEARGSAETVDDLNKIHSAGRHLLELINSVLDISKIEAGKMETFLEPFDVREVVQNVCEIAKPLVNKNGNQLVLAADAPLGMMISDRTKLRQSLFNLISNATKFTKQGVITLRVRRTNTEDGRWMLFSVTDTGIGMTPAQLEKLFHPFSQADASVSSKYGGTGLGLSITKQFCELLGGSITVESEYGKGTTFSIRLPAESGAPLPVPSTRASESDANAPAVLLIDDDVAIHDQLRRLLAKNRVRLISAFNGDEGIKLALTSNPQAILLDVVMRGIDGWQVLSRLKSEPTLSYVPLIMMTVVDERNAGFALGAREYLVKPVDRALLAQVIGRCCGPATDGHARRSVLIVDDEPDNRRVMRRLIEGLGWDVAEAEDGNRALSVIAVRRPDLILLDLVMPGMDGFAFMDELRKNPRDHAIPVIVVTAKTLTAAERQHLAGAVHHIVEKSGYSREELLRVMNEQVLAGLQVKSIGG